MVKHGGASSLTDGAAFERFLDALAASGSKITNRRPGRARARCPVHNGKSWSSLSLRSIPGRLLIYCHAGCPTQEVVDALGLTMADLFDDRRGVDYHYQDRTVTRTWDKQFRQKVHTNGTHRTTLYHLPEVIAAVKEEQTVYVWKASRTPLRWVCRCICHYGADGVRQRSIRQLEGGYRQGLPTRYLSEVRVSFSIAPLASRPTG